MINIRRLTRFARWSLVMFAILAVCSLALSAKATITFKQTTIDIGEAESGKVIDVNFEFENAGDETLLIKDIRASCGCTAAKLEQKEYQPGEQGIIPVRFFTQGFMGKVTKNITVITNDKASPYTIIKITGDLKLTNIPLPELKPDQVDFGEVKRGQKVTQKVTLKNAGSKELKILEVTHAPEMYPVFQKNIISGGEETEIEIVLTPLDAGESVKFMRLRTNALRHRYLLIKVAAKVKE